MNILEEWVNPYYLTDQGAEDIRQSVIAKPVIKYAVIDNFFNIKKLDELIEYHKHLEFSELDDRVTRDGNILPYDGSVVFAKKGVHFGSELFFNDEWHRYCCYLTDTVINNPRTEIKLRYHRPDAEGFWIHTDSIIRNMVIITYFNKGWTYADGGLLQLWRMDEATSPSAFEVNSPEGRLDFLTRHKRIKTRTPGGGFPDKRSHDLTLIDQIVPAYNRVFMCNFKHSLAYHSVTPSNGKSRLGFVQWISEADE